MTEKPEKQKKPDSLTDPIIGIDLGTTNSLVAYCDEAGPRILHSPDDRPMLPSVVRFDRTTGQASAIGDEARAHAVEFPSETIFSIKRLMGRSLADVAGELNYLPYQIIEGEHQTARVRIGEHVLSPQQISAIILTELRHRAERVLQTKVRKAVITVPAYFDDAQRQATRDAGRIAGLEVVRIVNEPTAAALAYNLGEHHDDTRVVVFDLGGGTFDVSILRLQKTEHGTVDQVLATAGDTHLGGDDVDRMIVELIQCEIREQFGESLTFPPATRQAFRQFAESTKIRLSEQTQAEIEIDLGEGKTYRRTITRDELEAMAQPWIDKAIACCKQALSRAKLKADDIERVVMVGGSTRMPMVQRAVEAFFKSEPYTALDPDQVVALGAAAQAAVLSGVQRDTLLLDVIPLSLGIETVGGAVAKLIVANSTIPARATEKFTTYVDGQTNVKIHVLQGERELVQDCRSLGQFELRGIPPMPAGIAKLEVTFLVDANGILSVSAIEQRSGIAASIQVVPSHGLTREEVDRMERESLEHAREDMTAHRLIDLRANAGFDLRNIERQLEKIGDELEPNYRATVQEHVKTVRGFIEAKAPDANAFQKALDAMDKATVRLAELSIKKALQETS